MYAYIGENGLPYYIGMGKNNRAFVKHHGKIQTPDRDKIIFCETRLTQFGAWAIERKLIRLWGRKHIDPNGILENKHPGGPTSPPKGAFKGLTHSKESNLKRSEKLRGRKNTWIPKSRPEHSKLMSGKNNPKANKIIIYNSHNEIKFICEGNFGKVCEENNLPYNLFRGSYVNNGKPIVKNNVNRKYSQFYGWYAKSFSIH